MRLLPSVSLLFVRHGHAHRRRASMAARVLSGLAAAAVAVVAVPVTGHATPPPYYCWDGDVWICGPPSTPTPTPTPNPPDLGITSLTNGPLPAGGTGTYTVAMYNWGWGATTGEPTLTMTSSGAVSITSASGSGWSCTVSDGEAVCQYLYVISARSAVPSVTVNVSVAAGGGAASLTASIAAASDSNASNNQATDSTTVSPPSADVGVTVTASSPTVNLGSDVTCTVTAIDNGPLSATGVAVHDLLPEGMTLVSATPSAGTYESSTGTWTIGGLGNGSTATLTLVGHPTSAGSFTDAASKVAEDQPDASTWNDSSSASVTALSADVGVSLGVDNATPVLGANVTLTVNVSNLGPSAASGVAITDLLPAGLTHVSHTAGAGSYDPTTGVWTVGSLDAPDGAQLTIVAQVASTGPLTDTATKTAENEGDPSSSNDSAAVVINAQASDIAVVVGADDPTPNLGSTTTLTLTATNHGPSPASGVQVTDQLPAGLSYVSDTGAGAYDPTTGVWAVGSLGVDDTATLQIVVRVTGTEVVTDVASRTGSTLPDPIEVNDSSSVSLQGQQADVAVGVSASTTTPSRGGQVTFDVTVSNHGPTGASGVTVSAPLPGGMTLVSATPADGTTYDASSGTWTVGRMEADQTLHLELVATVSDLSAHTMSAAKTVEVEPDPTPGNDTASVTVQVPSTDLAAGVAASNVAPKVGDTVTLTLTVTNRGTLADSGVTVGDLLPAGLAHVSDTGAGAYDPATGAWTVGSLAAGASGLLQITATVKSAAPATDTAGITAASLPDSDLSNDTASVTVTGQQANLAVSVSPSTDHPAIGQPLSFTVTVSNSGPSTATGVVLHNPVPSGTSFMGATTSAPVSPSVRRAAVRAAASVPAQSYDQATGTWTVGTIPVGGHASLLLSLMVQKAGAIVDTATLTALDQATAQTGATTASATVASTTAASPVPVQELSNSAPTPIAGADIPAVSLLLLGLGTLIVGVSLRLRRRHSAG